MYSKDFNILGLKVQSSNNKKDISFVTDINSYVQKIENICRLQKKEIPSSINLGVDYFSYIFDPISNKGSTEDNIAVSLRNAIKDITVYNVSIVYSDDRIIILEVTFGVNYQLKNNKTTCRIEVELT